MHMDSISVMGVYQCKTLIKHLIKSILRSAGRQKQLFYGLSALLSTPVCFSRRQLKCRKSINADAVLCCYCEIGDRCFITSAAPLPVIGLDGV